MLYHNIIDISQCVDINKASATREGIISHYWYLVNEDFRFLQTVCNV